MTTRRHVPLRDNPDQPHAFQPRKVTDHGVPLGWRWWDRRLDSQFDSPCRHCGGSKSLLIHWVAA